VKLAVSLLALAALSLTACRTNTPATKRGLYEPIREDGPYNRALHNNTWRSGVKDGPRVQIRPNGMNTKAAGATTTTTTTTTDAATTTPAAAAPLE
jgi:hypothetical protein